MYLIKKILTLKQVESGFAVGEKSLSGICRIECENGAGELFLTLINACRVDGYAFSLCIIDGKKKEYSFNMDCFPKSFRINLPKDFSFDGGLIVGVCAVKDGSPQIIAFCKEDNAKLSLSEFRIAVITEHLSKQAKNSAVCKEEDIPTKNPPSEEEITEPTPTHPPYPPTEQPDPTVTPPQEFPSPKSDAVRCAYDDEAVATENYYELDNQLKAELSAVKRSTIEKVLSEDGSPLIKNEGNENRFVFEEFSYQTDETAQNKNESDFFSTVKNELEQLFNDFQSEEGLEKAFLNSRWARVYYAEDKFYVVGVIKENGAEKYICYGVPAVYSEQPPKELDGYCTFIPNSVFDLNGDGYWMLFQDAVSGKCVTPRNEE